MQSHLTATVVIAAADAAAAANAAADAAAAADVECWSQKRKTKQ